MRTVDRFKHALWLHHVWLEPHMREIAETAIAKESIHDLCYEWFERRGYMATFEWKGGQHAMRVWGPQGQHLGLTDRLSIAVRGSSLSNIAREAAILLYSVQMIEAMYSAGATVKWFDLV